ncbi:Rrf2 family transcriptional regulator [Flexithrix dorotheae]|uniref:Rrf2 family transcriptional regulator n=1 Tax=Flexithrix dorotheae TaxID=70993 RepID=UPI00035CFD27|nr:Rrf2 family transcriptional regulator [Flexithrix dorotheae]
MKSSKFIVATHIMTILALKEGRKVTSADLAWSINTNPVLVRKLIGHLKKSGLVVSETGADGGNKLAKKAFEITLLDIYSAIETKSVFQKPYSKMNKNCGIARNILPVLGHHFNKAELALMGELRKTSLKTISLEIIQSEKLKLR